MEILPLKREFPFSGEERCTFLFAKNRTSVFAENYTFLIAEKCTLLFSVYSLLLIGKILGVNPLNFDCFEKTFCNCIVPAISFSAHTSGYQIVCL